MSWNRPPKPTVHILPGGYERVIIDSHTKQLFFEVDAPAYGTMRINGKAFYDFFKEMFTTDWEKQLSQQNGTKPKHLSDSQKNVIRSK